MRTHYLHTFLCAFFTDIWWEAKLDLTLLVYFSHSPSASFFNVPRKANKRITHLNKSAFFTSFWLALFSILYKTKSRLFLLFTRIFSYFSFIFLIFSVTFKSFLIHLCSFFIVFKKKQTKTGKISPNGLPRTEPF